MLPFSSNNRCVKSPEALESLTGLKDYGFFRKTLCYKLEAWSLKDFSRSYEEVSIYLGHILYHTMYYIVKLYFALHRS